MKTRIALASLAVGIACVGFAPIFMRLSELGPAATALYRVLLALPFFLLWLSLDHNVKRKTKEKIKIDRSDWIVLLLSGLFWSGDLIFWHWSISRTNVANATFLACSSPIFVIIGARILFKEHISGRLLSALALTLFGGSLLVGTSLFFNSGDVIGDIYGIITAVFFGLYLLTIKKLRSKLPTGTIMFWSGLFSIPGLLLAAIFTGEYFIPLSLMGWTMLLCLALFVHFLGQGLAAYALAHLPASFTSIAFLGEPVVATILGWIILSEHVGFIQSTGCIIVLIGIWWSQRISVKSSPTE